MILTGLWCFGYVPDPNLVNEEEMKEGITAGVVGFADDLFLFSNDKSEKGTSSMLETMLTLKHDLEERGLKLKVEKTHVFTKER